MSIKRSLQTYILLLATIPVIAITVIAYLISSNKYLEITKSALETTAYNYKEGFLAQLDTQIVESESLANINEIKSLLVAKVNDDSIELSQSTTYYDDVKETLIQTSNNFGGSVNYYLYDIDGYLVTSTSNENEGDWYENMYTNIEDISDTTIYSSSSISEDNKSINIVTPVIVKTQVVGLLRSSVNINYFGAFISEDKQNYILSDDNYFLFGLDDISKDETLINQAYDKLNSFKNDENSSVLYGTITDTDASNHTMYGYCIIPEYNWIYIIKQDGESYNSIVASLPFILLVVLVLLLLISSSVSAHLAQKYTDPILTLNSKMMEASEGKLDVHCNIESDDEFGQLSNKFNNMMDIICANYNEIANTKQELEASKEELTRNYNHIEELAYHDGLTGLYNRIAFMKYAYDILHDGSTKLRKHAVIFIDLDNFKNVNDTLGHDYGDLLLKQVSNKLSSYVADDDILARTGGDEFLILRNVVSSNEELDAFAATLVTIATHPFILNDETVHISMSVGVAVFPQNGLSLNELIKNADIAMYSAKTSGKNNYMFFNSIMEDEVNRRNDLIDILREAIVNKEVYLLYQAQADAATGKITGYEALMRIRSTIVGLISPDEFIPVAEECGLIDELGEWALYEACSFNMSLIDKGFEPITVSVNISTVQLRGNRILDIISSIPSKTGMPLCYLEIEITESILMKNFEHNLEIINKIKDMGAKISLDDFGTGYSSFNYLTSIPINTLKIDKSFIAGICNSAKDKYIAETIINLSHKLGITVIAEGVEDIEQLRILQSQSCDKLQGYFFSKPVTGNDFIQILRDNK